MARMADRTLSPSHVYSQHVGRVADKILRASNLGRIRGLTTTDEATTADSCERDWNLIVVEDPTPNAFASTGLLMIHTGALPVCQDENGMATLLGHGTSFV